MDASARSGLRPRKVPAESSPPAPNGSKSKLHEKRRMPKAAKKGRHTNKKPRRQGVAAAVSSACSISEGETSSEDEAALPGLPVHVNRAEMPRQGKQTGNTVPITGGQNTVPISGGQPVLINFNNPGEISRLFQFDQEPRMEPIPEFDDTLGDHVPQSTKQKIWDNQFVNLNSLLPDREENTNFDMSESSPLVITKNGQIGLGSRQQANRKVANINAWTDAFIIFVSIYLQKYQQVQIALDLLKYLNHIRWAAAKVGGLAWRQYDEQFRLRKAKKPTKSWATLDLELWLLFVSSSTPLNQLTSKSGLGDFTSKPKGICWDFNGKKCSRAACKFKHICNKCSGPHPELECRFFRGQQNRNAQAGGTSTFTRKYIQSSGNAHKPQ